MKKKMSEKRKKGCMKLGWATAHLQFVLGHDTTNCIVTQSAQQARMARQDTATIRSSTAMTRRNWAATRPAIARDKAQRARHGVLYRDTGFVSRQGGSARVS